jgi:hypothetical protein
MYTAHVEQQINTSLRGISRKNVFKLLPLVLYDFPSLNYRLCLHSTRERESKRLLVMSLAENLIIVIMPILRSDDTTFWAD